MRRHNQDIGVRLSVAQVLVESQMVLLVESKLNWNWNPGAMHVHVFLQYVYRREP